MKNKDQFEKDYCKQSGITIEQYNGFFNQITLPCNCGDKSCERWAAVTNTPLTIKAHENHYM